MKFVNYEESTQAITVTQLVETVYTFYVQFQPTDPALQALNQKKANGGTLTTAESAQIDNSFIWQEMAPVVTLYAHEQEGPIVQYQVLYEVLTIYSCQHPRPHRKRISLT
jgi:hypothetical protein